MSADDVVRLRPFEEELNTRAVEARGNLSHNDERVLAYLRDRLDDLVFHTSDSLAQEVGVSRAAIVRFARKLGFDGFTDLRDAARRAVTEPSPLARFGDAAGESLLARKTAQDTRNLVASQALIRDELTPTSRTVAAGERVFVVGNRKSFGLAVYLHRLLTDVRPGVHLVEPGFPDELATLTEDDVLVAFLYRRYSRQTLAVVESALQTGARVVVLTDSRSHTFGNGVAHLLVALADSPALYDSMVAPIWLAEALVAEVAAVDPERSKATLEAAERFNEEHRVFID